MVKNKNGITLIEIMAVIGIIIILAAVVTPVSLSIMKKAYVKKTQAMIAQLEGALALYYNDWGYYPATKPFSGDPQRNSNAKLPGTEKSLVETLTDTVKSGPYISLKKDDLDSSGRVLLDPWGMAYVYVARKYVQADGTLANVSTYGPFWPNTSDPSRNTYNIYSFGPDGKTESGGTDVSDPNSSNAFNNSTCGNNSTSDGASNNLNDDDINNWSQQE